LKQSCYFSLGSNTGNRTANISRAINKLRKYFDIIDISSIYLTYPQEYTEQPLFFNCAVKAASSHNAHKTLEIIKAIETQMKRVKNPDIPKGPRNIDIDLILYGNRIINDDILKVPHPGMNERKFVLLPLLELNPELTDPKSGLSLNTSLEKLEAQGIYYLPGKEYTSAVKTANYE
jgi:2-amino-4-hydroxy-6-hydroxymethyldihydropteridine diphosphokinase